MCTGMRIVRAWSAMARVIAWRIHHVAYVENLKPLRVVELLDRADQAEVAFLDQVEEQHAAADVALGDAHDEAQVRLDQLALGELPVALDPVQPRLELVVGLRPVALRDLVAADALDLAERA